MAPGHLVPSAPGVVTAAMAWEDRDAREAADEEYMTDLELVEAEREVDGEFIIISDDEEQGGGDGGAEKEFDAEEWRHIFLDSGDDGTGSDPMGVGMSKQDWLDHYYVKDDDDE